MIKSHPFQSVPISSVYFYYVLETTFLIPKLRFSFLSLMLGMMAPSCWSAGSIHTASISVLLSVTLLHQCVCVKFAFKLLLPDKIQLFFSLFTYVSMYVCMHTWSRAREHACVAYVCGGHRVMLRVFVDDLSTFSFAVELLSSFLR